MVKAIKVGVAALNQTPLAWDTNAANIREALQRARAAGVSVLCLPELCITGYGCEDAFQSPGVHHLALEVLRELLPDTHDLIVTLGLPILVGGGLFDAACVVANGRPLGIVAKQNLARDGLHYEPRWFQPWPRGVSSTVDFHGEPIPVGDLVFDVGGVRLGLEICEDAWVADRPGAPLAQRGVDLLLNPSASHFAFAKHWVRQQFVVEGSRAFHVTYLLANLMGNEAGRAIYDGDALIAHCGRLLARGPRFSYADVNLTTAIVDLDASRMSRAKSANLPVAAEEGDRGCVRTAFSFPTLGPAASSRFASAAHPLPAWEESRYLKEEEFARAVPLALFDYLRKSHSRGFVVSLSGGADSSAVSILCSLMVRLGIEEIGRDAFLQKLSYIPDLTTAPNEAELVKRLLTCVYQSTRNSSDTTRHAARQVASSLGARMMEWDVDEIVQAYITSVSQALGRKLTWETDDLALQNIQARARGPSVWLLANLQGALLLATSNRSEAAVGYATMDGDTCGGLAPIAGIDKAFLRHWLKWLETNGMQGHEPLAMLAVVNEQAPTAELRPPAAVQTDESDLMPYEILDVIERLAIRDKLTPREIWEQIQAQFTSYSGEQLSVWVERFFTLWCRNQWKRERYAPSFHVDDENLDPKTWCRFPILSGGYARELRELRGSR